MKFLENIKTQDIDIPSFDPHEGIIKKTVTGYKFENFVVCYYQLKMGIIHIPSGIYLPFNIPFNPSDKQIKRLCLIAYKLNLFNAYFPQSYEQGVEWGCTLKEDTNFHFVSPQLKRLREILVSNFDFKLKKDKIKL